jgi:hypothetical protein
MPGYSAIRDTLAELDAQGLEDALRGLMAAVKGQWPAGSEWQGVAIDGKTLRGSNGEEGPLRLLIDKLYKSSTI